jgi:hypothetical protein
VRLLSVIFVIIFFAADATGQIDSLKKQKNDSIPGKTYVIQQVTRNGETLPEVEIKEVKVYPSHPAFPRKSDFRKYERLVKNIKKVYPYALIVRNKFYQVNDELISINSEKERKAYLKKVEKDVFAEYENDIRNMTITQGRLLIKLIDRETQNTSYSLIKEYRGKFSAAFWQGIARIFGTNLKEEYDANGEDLLIETIIQEIDAGRL